MSYASFSPDGAQIVSAAYDSTVRIWDALTGAQLKVLDLSFVNFFPYPSLFAALVDYQGLVFFASFSPDGSRIVTASADGTIRIWDALTGAQLQVLHKNNSGLKSYTDAGHGEDLSLMTSASFSPDGSRIVSASSDKTVRIWDVATGAQLNVLMGHTSTVYSAFFSLDGSRIVSASEDNTIRIWDASTGAQLKVLEGHMFGVSSALYAPGGSRIVSASGDNTIRIWDVETGGLLHVLKGHTSDVTSASFSPDGARIVSASSDNTIRIWDFPPLQKLIDQTRKQFDIRKLTPEERMKYYL